jgi:hypothetical protein
MPKLLALGIKNIRVCFVIHSFLRNFVGDLTVDNPRPLEGPDLMK